MRHSPLPAFLFLALLPFTSSVRLAAQQDPDLPAAAQGRIDKATYLRLRAEHTAMLRGLKTPVPPYARSQAIRALEKQQRAFAKDASLSGLAWTPIGPAPLPSTVAFSGRVTAIAVHPSDPAKVYVGTAFGGVYRSLDGGATWKPIMDQALSLAVGALAIDPSNPTRLWVGTGEASLGGDSYYGVGLYRIDTAESDAPSLLGPFSLDDSGRDVFTYASVSRILVHPTDPNTLFVATSYGFFTNGGYSPPTPPLGVYRTHNALANDVRFSRLAVPAAQVDQGLVSDAILEPGNPDHLLCTTFDASHPASSGVWRTTNANAVSPVFTHTLALPMGSRGSFAASRKGGTVTVLVAASDPATNPRCSSGEAGTLRRSTDGGQTWSAQLPAADGFCGVQCDYDAPVAMAPADATRIYLGGPSDNSQGCSLAFTRSTDGGDTFSPSGTSNRTLHADAHVIVVAPTSPSTLYMGNDGGIFKSIDGGQSWIDLNNGQFNATQFYTLALHPVDREILLGGTQDNGTVLRQGTTAWSPTLGGDGGFAAIDSNATRTTGEMYATYYSTVGPNGNIGFNRASTMNCAAQGSWAFRGCGYPFISNPDCDGVPAFAPNGIHCDDSAVLFLPPMVRGPGNPNTLYFGTDRLYRSTDRGDTMKVVSQQFVVPSSQQSPAAVSAIAIAPEDDRVRLVGLNNGHVFLTTNGSSTLTDVTGQLPSLFIARFAIDPNDPAVAYVTLDGYTFRSGQAVWKTADLTSGHPTWTPSGGGIPDIPVNAFAIDPANSQHLFAGTDIGVYYSADGGAQWVPFSNALPRVPVLDLGFLGAQHVLRAATHGRGIWEITPPASGAVCTPGPTVLCIDDQPGDSRWQIQVAYDAGTNGAGSGAAVPLASLGVTHGGLFWFFSPDNPEMLIKVLNACSFNQEFWVFYAAGTNVGLITTVTDTRTGRSKTYTNAPGLAAPPVEDTSAFSCDAGDAATAAAPELLAAPSAEPATGEAAKAACVPDATTLCIDGRYRIRVTYSAPPLTGSGTALPLASLGVTHGGLFWFFGADNPEMLIKVLDACTYNQKHWVFFSATTDVGFQVTVTDAVTGASVSYGNIQGTPAKPVLDVSALPCP